MKDDSLYLILLGGGDGVCNDEHFMVTALNQCKQNKGDIETSSFYEIICKVPKFAGFKGSNDVGHTASIK